MTSFHSFQNKQKWTRQAFEKYLWHKHGKKEIEKESFLEMRRGSDNYDDAVESIVFYVNGVHIGTYCEGYAWEIQTK